MSVATVEFRIVANRMENLENYVVALEEKCEAQAEQLRQLTKVFGNSCEETAVLKKRLTQVEVEKSELQQLLLGLQKELDNLIQVFQVQAGGGGGSQRDIPIALSGGAKYLEGYNGKDPMTVFPEEVWTMIFGYLKDPKDLKSCYETCTKFQLLLLHERRIFLYGDVLNVLTSRGYLSRSKLTTSTLLTTRLVCTGWKECVNNFLEDNNQEFFHEPANLLARTHLLFTSPTNPWSSDEGPRNMDSDMNPMIGRYLVYKEARRMKFRTDFIEFLQKFGHHVWFFEIHIDIRNCEKISSSWYPFLLRCLSLLPNLKALWMDLPRFSIFYNYDSTDSEEGGDGAEVPEKRVAVRGLTSTSSFRRRRFSVYGSQISDSSDEDEEIDREQYISVDSSVDSRDSRLFHGYSLFSRVNKRKLGYLQQEISENGFPTIPTLKTLVIQDSLPSVMRSVLMANPQIKTLAIKRSEGQVVTTDGIRLGNLQELSIGYHGNFWNIWNDMAQFTRWRFRKLSIDIPNMTWQILFKTVEKYWGDTLVELSIKLCGPQAENFPRLFLRNLKVLKVTVIDRFRSLDFLLPLVNLEYLSVDLQSARKPCYNRQEPIMDTVLQPVIDLGKFMYCLEASNIWKLLPKLRKAMVRLPVEDDDSDDEDDTSAVWNVCTRPVYFCRL